MQVMNPAISIRTGTIDNLAQLIDLGRRTFIETYKGMGHDRPKGLEEIYGRETFNSEKLTPQLEGNTESRFILAFVNSTAAGFAKLETGLPPSSVPNKNSIQLAQIYVLKEFQGLGLGKTLFDKAKKFAEERSSGGLWLGVWDANTSAIKFHEKMGFKQVGTAAWKFKHNNINYEDTDLIMYLDFGQEERS